jgi:predicted permease
VFQDLRYALRQLRRSPGFTAVVIITLALGIGANATVLCWLRNLVQRPVPGAVDQPSLAVILSNWGGGNASLQDVRDLGALDTVLAGAAVSMTTPASLAVGDELSWTYGQIVSANFFDLLGVRPLLGRGFQPGEDTVPGGNPVVVIGERLWRQRFASDPQIVGRTVDLNRHRFTVIGVTPDVFRGTMNGLRCEFWAPISMFKEITTRGDFSLERRNYRGFHTIARLRPGVSIDQAQAAFATVDTRLEAAFPATNRGVHHRILPYTKCPYGAQSIAPVLHLLLAVTLGVLLIVAANVANLMLARAESRRREIAIRLATGASRWRLVRQLLTESLALAIPAGLLGIVVATWGVDLLGWFVPRSNMPIDLSGFRLDAATLGLTLLLTLAAGIFFGLLPALQSLSPKLYETLKESGRSTGGTSRHRIARTLVVAEVALALTLLIASGLCLKGLREASRLDLGFDPEHVLVAQLQVGMNGHNHETAMVFYRQLEQRLATLPGVEQAALATWFPLGFGGCKGLGAEVEGYVPPAGQDPTYEYAAISPRYFATMRIPLLAGRDFTETDDAQAPLVAIVNEAFANRFWPGREAVGQRFNSAGRWRTVVGVVKTGRYENLHEEPRCFFYLPYRQRLPDLDLNICVRTSGDPAAFANALRQAVATVDPRIDLYGTIPMTEAAGQALLGQRIATDLLSVLGAVALFLSAMGVYAVMAHAVGQRTQEFGVRLALGASPADVLRLVGREGLVLAALGILVGLGLTAAATRLLTGFIHGVSAFDPVVFLLMSAALLAIVLAATCIPARRATRVDPMVALRNE